MTKPLPLTAARLERALDSLAEKIIGYGDRGRELLPLYNRLETELAAMKAEDALMASVRARVTLSKDRTAGRSS